MDETGKPIIDFLGRDRDKTKRGRFRMSIQSQQLATGFLLFLIPFVLTIFTKDATAFSLTSCPDGCAIPPLPMAIDDDLIVDQLSGPKDQVTQLSNNRSYAVLHYLRDDGVYGDHSSSDFNDYWGLHLWLDIDEVIEWTDPKPFLGEDEYGRFAWVKLPSNATNVGFIVHRGDIRDGTSADRFFNPSVNPEIWLKNDDANTYTSQAEAQGFVTIHYHRDGGDYGNPNSSDFNDFWGLHLWGDAIDPSEGTSWAMPKKPTGLDDYGAFWNIQIVDPAQLVNFIIHRGDTMDPGQDENFTPEEVPTVWKQSGDVEVYSQRGAAENFATIHYHREDGDYGDPNSSNFNDYWGLHVWNGAFTPTTWIEPLRWDALDSFGPAFKIELADGASELAYILHRGDIKDPGSDQFLTFDPWGYEVWQLEGEGPNPEQPHYVLPILAVQGTYSYLPIINRK
jgi:hypothetical protein